MLRVHQDLPDLAPRMIWGPRDGPTAHSVPMRPAYAFVVVHREHRSPAHWLVFQEKNQHPETGAAWKPHSFVVATVSPFYAPISQRISQPWVGRDCAPITTAAPSFRFHQAKATALIPRRRQYATWDRPQRSHRSNCRRQCRARSVIVHLRPHCPEPQITKQEGIHTAVTLNRDHACLPGAYDRE